MNCDMVWGGAGFIGSHLVDELIKLGRKVIVVDNLCRGDINNISTKAEFINKDVTDSTLINDIKDYRIDTLYNLATVGLLESLKEPERCAITELEIAKAGCILARNNICKRLVYFSSSEVYGDNNKKISSINEPKKPTTPYAVGKLAGQQLVKVYINSFKINAYVVIPFNNYGSRQTPEKFQGIIPLAIKNLMNNEPISINGTGNQVRDYIYVKDTIKWMLRAVYFYPTAQRVFNVGANNPISVLDLIERIAEIGGWEIKLKFRDKRLGDENFLACDVDPLIELTNFDEGLKETVKWYKEYYGKD